MMDELTLRAWALELGFALAALCLPAAFEDAKRWVDGQQPLAERRQLRFVPKADEPAVKSLAVLLWPYAPSKMPQGDALFIDSYYAASNAAYHAAKMLEARLHEAGRFAKANVSYPAKEAAVRAGLGIIGRNSLLITPQYGTRVVIILMATDIEPDETRIAQGVAPACQGCGNCAAACPAGAITARGMEHPERCLRNFMMEGIVVPEYLREKIGMRLLGCDICQRVCPMQTFSETVSDEAFSLSDFLTEDAAQFSAGVSRLAERIGKNAARVQRVRAQAALLAGNSKNSAYLPVLRTWMQLPFEAVRVHAQWAIEQIGDA